MLDKILRTQQDVSNYLMQGGTIAVRDYPATFSIKNGTLTDNKGYPWLTPIWKLFHISRLYKEE